MQQSSIILTMDNKETKISNRTAQGEDSLDKTHVTFNETPLDPENDSIDEKPVLQSKYLEVRSAVEVTDDVNMSAETFRAYTIGILLCALGSVTSSITEQREQPLTVEPTVVQLVCFPIGKLWAKYMPDKTISLGRWSFKLNPGPFSVKEHALIVVMANVACGWQPYGIGLIIVQVVKYSPSPRDCVLTLDQRFGFMYNALLLIGTEMIGYGLAGVCRRWLVYPAEMIWPSTLADCTLINTLHRDRNYPVGRWTISRYKLFFVAMVVCFGYSFLPQFLQILQQIEIFTLIWPKSLIVNTLFGMDRGLALLPLTLSYQTVITFLGSPQIVPAAAHFNIWAGMVFWFWIIAGIMYAKNIWWSQYFPLGSPLIYDNKGGNFDYQSILTPEKTLDVEAYKRYSPLLQGPRIALCYALSFASISCVLVNAALFDGKWMIQQLRRKGAAEDDIHMQQMRKYPEVPEWWFQVLLVVLFGVSLASVIAWPTFLPWWGFIITMLIPIIFIIPIGIIQARTSQQIGLNVITEFLAGYIWPGRPVANTLVKIYGYMAMSRGLLFVQDLKFGHYMKVPPRAMFRFQLIGTIIKNIAALGVTTWLINSVTHFCDMKKNTNGFTCPGLNVFFRATIIWGVIAPDRIFSPHAPYGASMWFFLIGALAPIPFYFAKKKWPNSWVKWVNTPLFFSGTGMIPPATPLHYTNWFAVGIFFNGWVMTRNPAWWAKYNYILGIGLSIGVTFCELLFSLLAAGGIDLSELVVDPMSKYFGQSLDSLWARGGRQGLRIIPEGETIGPKTWG